MAGTRNPDKKVFSEKKSGNFSFWWSSYLNMWLLYMIIKFTKNSGPCCIPSSSGEILIWVIHYTEKGGTKEVYF